MDILCTQLPYQKLQGVLRGICENGSESKENWAALVDAALDLTESLTQTLCMDVERRHELETLVIHLWNKTVLLKTQGTVQKQIYGKLRYISYQVIAFLNESSRDVASLKKQVMMGLKTTRAWIDVKEYQYADKVLKSLQETIQRLQRSFVERRNSSGAADGLDEDLNDSGKDFFYVLCLKAEVSFAQGQNSDAMVAVKKAGEMLSKFSSEASNMSMLCYNFGVDCYQSKNYEAGILWLRESCNISKDVVDPNPKTQARTLRLLANCYLEARCEDWKESALNAVTLANQKHGHVAGLYVRLQLLLETEESEPSLQDAMGELTNHPNFDMDICLNTLRLYKNFQRPGLAFAARQKLLEKFERHPKTGSLLVTLLDVLLHSADEEVARTFAEECITAHNTGRRLEGLSLKQFHIFFWMKAAQYFEERDYKNAVIWYNYSLSLYPSLSVSEPNLDKLQRNLANCYLNLGEISKAKAAIEIAERCDKKDAHTQYIILKIALEMDDSERATSSLKELVDCVNNDQENANINIICLVAQTALEQKRTELATVALTCLISHSDKDRQVLTALKCLLRLLLDEVDRQERFDRKELLCHIRTAYNKILGAKDRGRMATAEIEEEATWLMKIAWNLALQCKEEPFCLKEFFNLCFQLLSLCPQTATSFQRHQNCLLMSCAACLQLVRQASSDTKQEMQELLDEVLQHIEEFKQAERRAQNTLWSQGAAKTPASTEMFLLLFEFEALSKLRDAKAEAVLERALTMPSPSPKLFHTFSVLAMDAPANNRRLSVRALKVAIRLYLQAENPDFIKCSADVRNLINMSLVVNEKEAMIYFKETMDMIENRAKDLYPEMELLWLMTKAWNWGLQHYNSEKLDEAENWCSTSMAMLKYLPSYREQYQDQMMSVYGEILNRLESRETKQKGLEE